MWDPLHDNPCECSSLMNTEFSKSNECCKVCLREVDKENIQQRLGNSPMKHESDLSLYGSPGKITIDNCSPTHCTHRRRPLEDHDANSQDSGYGAGFSSDGNKFFRLARSLGVTPREEYSPPISSIPSFNSMDSMDDEFLEFTDMEPPTIDEENSRLPADFNSLITGTFPSTADTKTVSVSPVYTLSCRPLLKRSLSLNVECHTPNSSKVRSCLFKNDNNNEMRAFKRPEPPAEVHSPIQNKRSKVQKIDEEYQLEVAAVPQSSSSSTCRPLFRRSFSATEESIKHALHRSSTEPDLIGDFSIGFGLPLISGRHQDLKSITPTTLAMLIRGDFNRIVACYKVIDCRYPYEYDGGHIDGAANLYTKDQILELLNIHVSPPLNPDPIKRQILVFHCEFSSERGPNLYRCLRNFDRIRNKDSYPALYYPEIYLLEGGYKHFYEQYSELCVPISYTPMLHPQHESDLRHFRAKSKTSERLRSGKFGGMKRLGFP